MSRRAWIAVIVSSCVAVGALVVAIVGLVEVGRARQELTEARAAFESVRSDSDRLDAFQAVLADVGDRADSARDVADATRRDLTDVTALLSDFGARVALLETAPLGLTLADVEDAIGSGRILVPAGSILPPVFCGGEFAVWAFLGLSC